MKSEFRRFHLNLRREMEKSYIQDRSNLIVSNLIASDFYKNSQTIFVYVSVDKEVSTRNFIQRALTDKKEVYVPKIIDKEMKAVRLNDIADLVDGVYKIPTSKSDTYINNPDLTICPGLAFDEDKNRLGYGAGFYDKFLSANKTTKIALAISDFCTKKIPVDSWDIKMDYIITEEEIF